MVPCGTGWRAVEWAGRTQSRSGIDTFQSPYSADYQEKVVANGACRGRAPPQTQIFQKSELQPAL
jgi:hypothetical protein